MSQEARKRVNRVMRERLRYAPISMSEEEKAKGRQASADYGAIVATLGLVDDFSFWESTPAAPRQDQ